MTADPFHVEHYRSETLERCPICGCDTLLPHSTVTDYTVSNLSFDLQTCSGCGFCVTNPRPSLDTIGPFYESDSYISHTNTSTGPLERTYQLIRKLALRSKHRRIARHHISGRVLDFGCGTGEFLAFMRRKGYSVQGVEPNSRARHQAMSNHAISPVSRLGLLPTTESFDVVTLWHVLEHMHDISSTLVDLRKRMADQGILVVAVPDRESWDCEHYGTRWAAYDAPRHLSHFRRVDIHRLLRTSGFEMLSTGPLWFDAPYVSMLSERYALTGLLWSFLKGFVLGAVSNLVAATTSRPTSSTLYFARKAEPGEAS